MLVVIIGVVVVFIEAIIWARIKIEIIAGPGYQSKARGTSPRPGVLVQGPTAGSSPPGGCLNSGPVPTDRPDRPDRPTVPPTDRPSRPSRSSDRPNCYNHPRIYFGEFAMCFGLVVGLVGGPDMAPMRALCPCTVYLSIVLCCYNLSGILYYGGHSIVKISEQIQ